MKKLSLRAALMLAVAIATGVLLAGCGGSSGKAMGPSGMTGGTGALSVTVQWPDTGSRSIPLNTQSIKVIVAGTGDVVAQSVNRAPGQTQATFQFNNLKPGTKTVTAEAYSAVDAGGNLLGSGSTTVEIANDALATAQVTVVDLTPVESYIAQGQAKLNQVIAMDPMNVTRARDLVWEARILFQQARGVDANNSKANFGIAISEAALLIQELIAKYEPVFAPTSRADGPTQIMPLGGLEFWEMPSAIGRRTDPFRSFLSGFGGLVRLLEGKRDPSQQNILDMQADLRNRLLPMLRNVLVYLDVAEQDATFTFGLGYSGSDDFVLVDRGDLYLFDSFVRAAKAACAIPAAYNLDYGAFDWGLDSRQRDANGDKILTVAEYMPASPFATLENATYMQEMDDDLLAACDKAVMGIDLTLAETQDEFDLIAWHTAGSDVDRDSLVALKTIVTQVKQALQGPQLLPVPFSEFPALVKVNLMAWAQNPPADLKALAPVLEIITHTDYEYTWTDVRPRKDGFPDKTFGGLFPDGLPDELLYDPDLGSIGVIIK